MKKRQITLRKKNGPVVPTTREVVGSAMVRVVHLTPKAPLAANTRYVVLQQEPKGKPGVIREFTTGSSMDEESPRMLVRGIRYVDAMVTDGWNPGKRRSQTYALDFSAEVSPEDFGLYGIWLAENKQDIDFAKPPLTYIQHRGGALEFGQPASACPYDTLTLPENPTKQFIGIRLWDSAGNSSPPKVLQATPE